MKGFKKLGFFVAIILPLLVVVGFYLGNAWNYLTVFFAFIIIPLLDLISGLDTANVDKAREKVLSDEFYYRFITYFWTFIQIGLVVWGAYAVSLNSQNTLESIGFILSMGLITGGIGITVAHELGHKKSRLERFYSQALLMTVSYMHFYIEHNRGHHVLVATPEDSATARKNQNFYGFWFRSVFQGYAHAWKLETESLSRKGKSGWHYSNSMIWYFLLPLVFCASLILFFSTSTASTINIIIYFFDQSIIAFTLLELVNYVEHYGILRKKLPSGEPERVNQLHSWNASHLVSNFFLFQLQRHSDHHLNAIKRYQILKHYDESPQLPFGYPTMILIAMVPPLWFKMVNPILKEWEQKVYTPSIG